MEEFAKRAGLSKGYISQMENNCNPKTGSAIIPSADTFYKCSSVMGISFDDLINMVDENQPISLRALSDASSDNSLSSDELDLVHKYRALGSRKSELLEYLDFLLLKKL